MAEIEGLFIGYALYCKDFRSFVSGISKTDTGLRFMFSNDANDASYTDDLDVSEQFLASLPGGFSLVELEKRGENISIKH